MLCERNRRGEGEGRGGKIRGRDGQTEGEYRDKGTNKRRDIVTVGGGGAGCVLPAQPVGTNKQS